MERVSIGPRQLKSLAFTIRSDLKWNEHINEITTVQRLYLLRLLRRAGAPPDDLIFFTAALFAFEVEIASPVFHGCLPKYERS